MENQNSLVDFYVDLFIALYEDVASSADISLVERRRDIATLRRRISAEGLSFLTKTLPAMGKAIDMALSHGVTLQIRGFCLKPRTLIPRFLGSLVSAIFDESGRERSDASPQRLGQLRQLLFVLYKLKLPYKQSVVTSTLERFVEVDNSLSDYSEEGDPNWDSTCRTLAATARSVFRRALSNLDLVNILPKHGPGVVATGEPQWEKKFFRRLVLKLEEKYPYSEYFFFNKTHLVDRLDPQSGSLNVTTVPFGTAKLIVVPKDSRGPRLISAEPLENQWIQQGQMQAIVDCLQKSDFVAGRVNFTDQRINQRLALESSTTHAWVTLDMKDASDRVSMSLVRYLCHPEMFRYIDASRSVATELPDGRIHPLRKFAPMGSAICFPIEATVFWALSVSVLHHIHKIPLSRARSLVYVYGDDIIVPSDLYAGILQYLPKFELLFNEGKCCVAGSFRESCGVDAFKGVVVTPTRVSTTWSHRPNIQQIASYVTYSNSMWSKGYYSCARYIERMILDKRVVPFASDNLSGAVVFVRPELNNRETNRALRVKRRYNRHLQRAELFVPTIVSLVRHTRHTDWEELLICHNGTNPVYPGADPIAENKREYDHRKMILDQVWSSTHGASSKRAGVYAVRHRNRLQCRWLAVTEF